MPNDFILSFGKNAGRKASTLKSTYLLWLVTDGATYLTAEQLEIAKTIYKEQTGKEPIRTADQFKLTGGKYRGKTLCYVCELDKDYAMWLADNGTLTKSYREELFRLLGATR